MLQEYSQWVEKVPWKPNKSGMLWIQLNPYCIWQAQSSHFLVSRGRMLQLGWSLKVDSPSKKEAVAIQEYRCIYISLCLPDSTLRKYYKLSEEKTIIMIIWIWVFNMWCSIIQRKYHYSKSKSNLYNSVTNLMHWVGLGHCLECVSLTYMILSLFQNMGRTKSSCVDTMPGLGLNLNIWMIWISFIT